MGFMARLFGKSDAMSLIDQKRVDWLYAHFQAISRASDRYFALYGTLVLSSIAFWLSPNAGFEIPFVEIEVDRLLVIGPAILAGAFVLVAFFGNYDQGEACIAALATTMKCDYEELWFIDTHPTAIDFAKYRRRDSAKSRRLPARASAALLYPAVLLLGLLWLTALLGLELFLRTMSLLQAMPFLIAIPVVYVAWHRGVEYCGRRWRTFLATERERVAGAA